MIWNFSFSGPSQGHSLEHLKPRMLEVKVSVAGVVTPLGNEMKQCRLHTYEVVITSTSCVNSNFPESYRIVCGPDLALVLSNM